MAAAALVPVGRVFKNFLSCGSSARTGIFYSWAHWLITGCSTMAVDLHIKWRGNMARGGHESYLLDTMQPSRQSGAYCADGWSFTSSSSRAEELMVTLKFRFIFYSHVRGSPENKNSLGSHIYLQTAAETFIM